jgi:hypothetical protein
MAEESYIKKGDGICNALNVARKSRRYGTSIDALILIAR